LIEDSKGRQVRGYPERLQGLPISTENVFHNYDESTPATAEFRLSNGNSLNLCFPERGECHMIPVSEHTTFSPRLRPSVRLFNPNGAGYFLSVKQWILHNDCRDLRRKAGWDCSCWWCAGR
jgi:hypothetical protein